MSTTKPKQSNRTKFQVKAVTDAPCSVTSCTSTIGLFRVQVRVRNNESWSIPVVMCEGCRKCLPPVVNFRFYKEGK